MWEGKCQALPRAFPPLELGECGGGRSLHACHDKALQSPTLHRRLSEHGRR